MSTQRIKGQEVSINLVRDSVVEDTITAIQDFEVTDVLAVISKGYLGEKSERKDMIYKGVKFSLKVHLQKQDYFAFRLGVINIAQRVTPDSSVSIVGVLNFPSGETPDFVIPDAQFGEIPMNVPARDDYVTVTLQGEAEQMNVTTS